MDDELFGPDLLRLVIAAAAGLIIGLERGWSHRTETSGQRVAGLRTFTLAAAGGGLCGILPGGNLLLAVLLAALAAVVTVAYFTQARLTSHLGITTEVALLITPLLGLLASRQPLEGMAAATLLAALLGFKQELHATLGKLDRDEVLATVQLLVVAVVVLPLLPDRTVGPFEAVNPRVIGWLVLLLLGVAYVGYFAVRVVGADRGLQLTALLGGFASSTAVTLAYARVSRVQPRASVPLSAGIGIACAMMAPRIGLLVSAIEPALGRMLLPTLVVLGGIPLAYALAVGRQSHDAAAADAGTLPIDNPFAIRAALVMAAALTALGILIQLARTALGDAGTYAVAALSGTLDVDAVSASLAQAHQAGRVDARVAGGAIVLAALVNTAVKTGMAAVVGDRALALRCLAVLGTAGVGAGITFMATW